MRVEVRPVQLRAAAGRLFQKEGAKVRAFDPAAMEVAKKMMPNVSYCHDEYEAAQGADAIVLVTEWNQFRNLNLEKMKGLVRSRNLVDLRNISDPKQVHDAGFNYVTIGRDISVFAHAVAIDA